MEWSAGSPDLNQPRPLPRIQQRTVEIIYPDRYSDSSRITLSAALGFLFFS